MPILTLENVKRRLRVAIADELDKFIPITGVQADPLKDQVQFKFGDRMYVCELKIKQV